MRSTLRQRKEMKGRESGALEVNAFSSSKASRSPALLLERLIPADSDPSPAACHEAAAQLEELRVQVLLRRRDL